MCKFWAAYEAPKNKSRSTAVSMEVRLPRSHLIDNSEPLAQANVSVQLQLDAALY